MSAEESKDVARLRQAFASIAEDRSPETFDAGRIFDALHGSMTPQDREAVIEEVLVNPAAAQAWRLALEMSPEPAARVPTAIAGHHRHKTAAYMWVSMAAAAVLAVGVSWTLSSSPEEPVYRTGETRTIAPDMPAGVALSRTTPVIRWTGIEGARYRVRVLTPELDVLQESAESEAREFRVSEQTLRRIAPGGRVLWQVEGRVPGQAVIVSPTFTIQVP